MIEFNLSMDFEMGWGDLDRLTADAGFYRRVMDGHEHTQRVIDMLDRYEVPSTWGVVGGCCGGSFDELQERAPSAFAIVASRLETLRSRHQNYRSVLFCPDTVRAIAKARLIELGSHGFAHLVPGGLQSQVLHDDVAASVRVLREVAGRDIESFIPPQNYEWPDVAFDRTGIRYIRHTPYIFGHAYSDPRLAAKLSRLWNDLVRPVYHFERSTPRSQARLLFLRIDRGARLWASQLRLIRGLLRSGTGSLFCFSHPHNLDSAQVLQRLEQLCESVAETRERGRIEFGKFVRQLRPLSASAQV